MYLSICKKNFNKFKEGELFDTYQKGDYAYIRPKGTVTNFVSIPFLEYQSYFTYFKDHIFLPIQKTFSRGIFRKKEIKEYKEAYFNLSKMNFEDLLAMQLPIINRISELSKVEGFAKYTQSIHKSLQELENNLDYPLNETEYIKHLIHHIVALVNEAQNDFEKEIYKIREINM